MTLGAFFDSPAQIAEKKDLPLLRALVTRYADERPFRDLRLAFSHILVRNSMVVTEALVRGGAEVILSDAHSSPASAPIEAELAEAGVPVLSLVDAAQAADIFVDVNAVLGRRRTPKAAAEVTRTGVIHYANIPCPVVSADDCKAKSIEGFFGTGDGFVRAWKQLRPNDPLPGKRGVQFGYGKIGRGVARRARDAGLNVTVVDVGEQARRRAEQEGFEVLDAIPSAALQAALAKADLVISVTGVPGVQSKLLPVDWLRTNRPMLVSVGAEDEYGPAFTENEILGGKSVPFNFQLAQPTLSRYIDPSLAAHALALEAWVRDPEAYSVGMHPLPLEMDRWLLTEWRKAWPNENLDGIGDEVGLV